MLSIAAVSTSSISQGANRSPYHQVLTHCRACGVPRHYLYSNKYSVHDVILLTHPLHTCGHSYGLHCMYSTRSQVAKVHRWCAISKCENGGWNGSIRTLHGMGSCWSPSSWLGRRKVRSIGDSRYCAVHEYVLLLHRGESATIQLGCVAARHTGEFFQADGMLRGRMGAQASWRLNSPASSICHVAGIGTLHAQSMQQLSGVDVPQDTH